MDLGPEEADLGFLVNLGTKIRYRGRKERLGFKKNRTCSNIHKFMYEDEAVSELEERDTGVRRSEVP